MAIPRRRRPASFARSTSLKPLKDDLDLWRLTSTCTDDVLVFPTATGDPFRDHDWRNWRHRIYEPVAKAVGIERSRPYDLRHSFVSLLIHEARSVVEVAAQAGHAPTMTLSTYAHVIAELEGAERVPAGTQILAARPCILRYRVRTLAPTARGARGDVPARTDTVGSRSFVVSAACPSAPASVPAAR